jgi:hypothetical protein
VGVKHIVLVRIDRTAVIVIVSGVLKMGVVTDGDEYPDEWATETENDV